MPSDEGVLDRFVDWCPRPSCFNAWHHGPGAYWARRTPVKFSARWSPRRPGTATMSSA